MAIENFGGSLGIRTFTSRGDLQPGKVVQFTYNGEQKYAIVLNPNWKDKMHAISLKALTPSTFIEIQKIINGEQDGQKIYDSFKSSTLVDDRPYRTYLLSKISTLREIFIKREILEDIAVTENMYGE